MYLVVAANARRLSLQKVNIEHPNIAIAIAIEQSYQQATGAYDWL